MSKHASIAAGLLVSGVLLALPDPARGAAFQLKEDSAVSLGNAFSGASSAADQPATVFDNPAGMTQLQGLQIQVGSTIVGPSFTFQGTSTNALGRPNTGFDNRDGGNAALIPNAFITYKLTPDLAIGLALTSPFGLTTTYGSGFIGRYQADKTELKTLNINPSVAYQVTSWLSLGAGVSAQYARAEFSSVLNGTALGLQTVGRPLADGYFRLRGDDWSFGWNVGALIKPGPGTNIGITYRSRVQQDFQGTADFVVPAPLNASARFRNSGGSAKLVLPDTASIGITQQLGAAWTVSGEVTWTNWSQFKNLNAFRDDGTLLNSTPQRYDNSYFAALGASYKVNEDLVLRAGTAYDKSPVSNAYRTARVPDASRIWLAVGVSYQILPRTMLDVGYAHIFVKDARIREVSSTGDVLSGNYRNSIDIGSVGTRLQF